MSLQNCTITELNELLQDRKELALKHGGVWFDQHNEIQEELYKRNEKKIVSVFYEAGYKWSVHVEGEGESRMTNVNKAEAMAYAKTLGTELQVQTMTRKERSDRMKYEHAHTETYNRKLW